MSKAHRRPYGRGRTARRTPGTMNNTEAEYALILDARVAAGEVAEYWYERWTFKLADDCRWTPDFVVMLPDGTLEIHEVKGVGFIEDHSQVKAKAAAVMFPLPVRVMFKQRKRDGGGFVERIFSGGDDER